MRLEDILIEHSKQIGVPLKLDGDGVCHLIINEKYVVNLETGSRNNFYFYSHVLQIAQAGNETLFRTLLQGHLYGKKTQGSVFALDPSGTKIILYREIDCESTDYARYYMELQKFVDQLAFWQEELQKVAGDIDPSTTSVETGDEPGQWIKM